MGARWVRPREPGVPPTPTKVPPTPTGAPFVGNGLDSWRHVLSMFALVSPTEASSRNAGHA